MTDLAGKRIASYSRFSTDKQSAASCADQHAKIARAVALRGGVVASHLVFSDDAISGAVRERPGLSALMRAVDLGDVDVLVCEDLSRLSRDTEDSAWIRKRLTYADVRLIALDDGHDSANEGAELMGDVFSAFKAASRRETGRKTLRGMEGRARAGLASGALPIGYTSRALPSGGFAIEIDPVGAETVRSVFERYAAGVSLADLAAELNAARVEAPRRGNGWQVSTVRQILHNARYVGRWAFGTTEWRRDPTTRRRTPRKRAKPLLEQHRPELVIVDAATWDAVVARFASSRLVYTGKRRIPAGQRMTYPLSGILKCGVCRSLMTIAGGEADRRYYRCAGARRGAGGCDLSEHIPERVLREATIGEIRAKFASPAASAHLQAIIAEEIAAANASPGRSAIALRLERTETKLRRLVDALADGPSSTIAAKVRELEASAAADRAEIERMADAAPPVTLRVPDAAEMVASVEAAIEGPPEEVRAALRAMLLDSELLVVRRGKRSWAVTGAVLLSCIAGAGFEPTTFGL